MRADDGRIVSKAVCQALAGEDITIYGTGARTRSFCYVDDMVEGLMRLMRYEGDDRGPLNLGNPVELPISRLVEIVLAATGSKSRVVYCPLPADDPRRRRPDISRAARLLGWEPKVPLAEGITDNIAWFAGEDIALAAAS